MIKAVLFDLGGVYFEDGTKKFINKLVIKTGKSFDSLYPIFREGKSLEYRENKITGLNFFSWAANKVGNILPDELNRLWVSQYTVIPGIKKLILDLKQKGIIVTILSDNVPERVNYLQEKYHFMELFDDAVYSYDVNLTKTSPDIFKLALKKIHAKPQEAIFVDDREINLEVAKKLNINTVLFKGVEDLKKELSKSILK
jgi:HAD superfamily hydrolase (TIGR01509 family)